MPKTNPLDDARLTLYAAARVYTHYPYRPAGDAVLVASGRVLAVGHKRALQAHAPARTRKIDLGDVTLTPGLTDAHTHFFYWALQETHVIDVTGLPSLDATLTHLRQQAPRRRVRGWVLGRGFDVNIWNSDFPTATDLDFAVPDAPCMVRSRDGHVTWMNTAALRKCGITARTPDPAGGSFPRDERGRPTGLAFETAIDGLPNPLGDLAYSAAPRDRRAVDAALQSAYRVARGLGFVGVHVLDDAASLATLQRHRRDETLGLRIVHSVPYDNRQYAYSLGLAAGVGDDWLRIGAIKIFSDGTLGSRTALMFDAYPGRPGYRGVGVVHGKQLRDAAIEAARHGWPIWVHAIGDRAVSETIDAIAAAYNAHSSPGGRRPISRIEHTQCIRPADIRRMARLGIVASVQPCHLLGDIATADRHWPRARKNAYALQSLKSAGVPLAMGSDVPVEPIDPRRSFFAAVQRQDERHVPAQGWFPRQRIAADDVLRGFTEHAVASAGYATPWGTLLPGAPADMTIWRDDPLRAPARELLTMRIGGGIIAGETSDACDR